MQYITVQHQKEKEREQHRTGDIGNVLNQSLNNLETSNKMDFAERVDKSIQEFEKFFRDFLVKNHICISPHWCILCEPGEKSMQQMFLYLYLL